MINFKTVDLLELLYAWVNCPNSRLRCGHTQAQTSQRELSPWCVWVCACVCVCTCAACGSLLDKVSQLTVADEGAFGVLAVAVETDVWVQVTLVHIWGRQGWTDTDNMWTLGPWETRVMENETDRGKSLRSGRRVWMNKLMWQKELLTKNTREGKRFKSISMYYCHVGKKDKSVSC